MQSMFFVDVCCSVVWLYLFFFYPYASISISTALGIIVCPRCSPLLMVMALLGVGVLLAQEVQCSLLDMSVSTPSLHNVISRCFFCFARVRVCSRANEGCIRCGVK